MTGQRVPTDGAGDFWKGVVLKLQSELWTKKLNMKMRFPP
jgi:hypothetical protein